MLYVGEYNNFNLFRAYIMATSKKNKKHLHCQSFGLKYNYIRTRAYYYVNKLYYNDAIGKNKLGFHQFNIDWL